MEYVKCVCVWLLGRRGCRGGEWMRGLGLVLRFTNPVGTVGVFGMCLCLGCGGVGGVGGVAGPGLCILFLADTYAS